MGPYCPAISSLRRSLTVQGKFRALPYKRWSFGSSLTGNSSSFFFLFSFSFSPSLPTIAVLYE